MADNDSSAWNVVVPKRQHVSSSSTPTPAWGKKSKQQQSQKPHGNKQQQQQLYPKQQQQHPPHQQKKATTHNNNNAKTQPSNPNHKKPQRNNMPNKFKPKPTARTVGDMLPLSKKEKLNKDGKKKISQQQQHPKAKQAPQNSYQRQPQKLQLLHSAIHVESVQDFPALGSSNFPALPRPAAVPGVPSKRGWGSVPKPPPAPPSSTFQSEAKRPSNRQSLPTPALSSSSQPSKLGAAQQNPTRVLKRGEVVQGKGVDAPVVSNKKKKEKPSNAHHKTKPAQQKVMSSASSFFQPRLRNPESVSRLSGATELVGEEHQLLRLMQERNIYQKKGRQRVAPRKKKFTALKKKVLQERLDQWRALHPEDVPDNTENNKAQDASVQAKTQKICITRSLCLCNYAELDELEDDDEYEEILENLTSMATKIGPIEEVFLPRSSVEEKMGDASSSNGAYRHPVFVLFQKESDASAALACWSDLSIGGNKLEVFGLEVRDKSTEVPSSWSERVLDAESKRRNEPEKALALGEVRSMELLLQKVLTADDFEDDDCMNESLDDLKNIAQRFGKVETIRAAGQNGDVLVTYSKVSLDDARGIAEELCRVVVGGQPLYASVCEPPIDGSAGPTGSPAAISSTLLLENVLTEEDLQDIDCLQESLDDIKELCLRYGEVLDVAAKGSAVKVTYRSNGEDTTIAQTAANGLNAIVLGGNTVKASVLTTIDDDHSLDHSIDLYNIITDDDMEDEDCMEESLGDLEKLASNYGKVVSINLCKAKGDSKNDATKAYVRIQFAGDDPSVVAKAFEGFNGMVIGGQIISASFSASEASLPPAPESTNPGDKRKPNETPVATASDNTKKARTDDKEPLYSGDKVISERFAAMKRVPKIPNKAGPREYAAGASTDERIKPLLQEMLGELMRLQKRAVEDKNAKARRRMVMGLREVARGIRAHKVKMVVMANNLDQYGVIDDKLQEIIDLAKSEGVPLFFEFTKRSLGKAIGKSIKIAVVGIQNADGAHQPFKKLNAIASRM